MMFIIIQIILNLLLCLFLRTCVRVVPERISSYGSKEPDKANARKMPRFVVPLLILLSVVPIAGVASFALTVILTIFNVGDDSWALADNRFVRYWITS
jgi:uncharacterized membrane protein